MDEVTENTFLSGPEEPECVIAAIKDETSLSEVFEDTLENLQDIKVTESAASEDTDSRDEPEQEDREKDGQHGVEKDKPQDGQRDGERDRQQDGETDRQQDGQSDVERERQQDGQTVHPPAAESSSKESKWVVGAQCRVVWLEDGRVYPATVVSLDRERCRVRFNGYGNQQDVELSALKSPDAAPQTQRQNRQDWKPGSRCRAVYSEDLLVYPAVVLWVKGQRCRIRFDYYNNEEEVDVSSLLSPDELHGPSRATAAKGSNWKTSVTSSNLDWKRREENQAERGGDRRREENQAERGGDRRREENQAERGGDRRREENQAERGGDRRREENQVERGGDKGREENQAERGGDRRREENQAERGDRRREENQAERGDRRSACRDDEQNFSWLKDKLSHQSKVEKEEEKKRDNQAEKPTNHSFSFFPPFPPPPRSASGDPVSFIPPPPPVWMFSGRESGGGSGGGGSAAVDASSSMLMLWYMCGFHTGSYMAQQVFSSKD